MNDVGTIDKAYTDTARLDIHELVRRLTMHLGPTLVATLAGVKSRQMPHRWAQEDGPTPSRAAYERLLAAHRLWQYVSDAEGDHVARAWFIGASPRLDEEPPVLALRDGRVREVMLAARAFVEGAGA